MAGTNGPFRLIVQIEHQENKNRSRIVKTEVLDEFATEADALREYKALLEDLMDDGDDDGE